MATKQQSGSKNEMNVGSFEAATEKPQPTKAAKKRVGKALKQIAAEKGISGPAIGAESINLSGDTAKLANEADKKAVHKDFVAKAQENADFLAKEFKDFGELCREAETAISNRDAFFNVRIKNPEFFRRCQDVRDFFATKSPGEYLVHDGKKHYRATEFFLAAIGVTFQYLSREMLKHRELYETLTGDKLPPKSNAGGRRTGSKGNNAGSGSGESPSGKVNVDELPEELRRKVLAQINGTQATETLVPDEVVPKFGSADELVEAIVNLLAIAEAFPTTDRLNVLRAVQQDVQQRLSATIDVPCSAQFTEGDSAAA